MFKSFYELFDYLDLPDIDILDVGASPIDGDPPYQYLKALNKTKIYGFEPNEEQYKILLETAQDKEIYLPYALGDGSFQTLYICQAPGMTSLLEPDLAILSYFHGFSDWAKIIAQECIKTYRLDDIHEIENLDYIKLDIQGGELTVIENGKEKISNSLVIHTEVNFVPFYKNQPLFAELDQLLRSLGFYLHTFNPLVKRTFKPMVINQSIYSGLNQVLWTDAIYVRQFNHFNNLTSEQLLKMAIILHDLYHSFDLSILALKHLDEKEGLDFQETYLTVLDW